MNKWMQDCRTWCWEVWVQHVGSRNLLSCAFNCVMFVCGCLMDLQALSFSPLLMVKLQRRKGPQAVGQFLVESRVGNVRPGFSHANLHVIFFPTFQWSYPISSGKCIHAGRVWVYARTAFFHGMLMLGAKVRTFVPVSISAWLNIIESEISNDISAKTCSKCWFKFGGFGSLCVFSCLLFFSMASQRIYPTMAVISCRKVRPSNPCLGREISKLAA